MAEGFAVRAFGPGVGLRPDVSGQLSEQVRGELVEQLLTAFRTRTENPLRGEVGTAGHEPVAILFNRTGESRTGGVGALTRNAPAGGGSGPSLEGIVLALSGINPAADEAALYSVSGGTGQPPASGPGSVPPPGSAAPQARPVVVPPHILEKLRADQRPMIGIVLTSERSATDPFVRGVAEALGAAFFHHLGLG